MKHKDLIIAIAIPIFYFSILWMVPWGEITPESWSTALTLIVLAAFP